jgi:electron transfer flavoprotein alpha subunit
VIADLIKEHQPEIFLLGATAIGEDLAPCIAAKVGNRAHGPLHRPEDGGL